MKSSASRPKWILESVEKMLDYILELFSSAQFVPHAVCLLWRPDLLVMHGVSDFFITAAYLTIPFLILKAVRQRPDLLNLQVARMFAAFIMACALSHLAGFVTLWVPAYGIQGVIKVATAIVSVYTAFQLARLLPVFLNMPSHEEMAKQDAEILLTTERADEAEAVRDKLSEFAYIASHDLKAPLRGIANQAKFLVEDHHQNLEPDAQKRLSRIEELCNHMDTLISTLLKYSRIGKPTSCQETHPDQIVAKIEKSLLEMLNDQNASIKVETDLPALQVNPADLTTVFQNLIVNGLKYNESDEKRISIGFVNEAQVSGRNMIDAFYVRDNGIGIDPEFQADAFLMFKRLISDDTAAGTGVGLAFVKKTIESYGGMIQVESRVGAGSTFYFSFSRQPVFSKNKTHLGYGGALDAT